MVGKSEPLQRGKKDPHYTAPYEQDIKGEKGMLTRKSYSEKFRKAREKWKKKNVRREKKGKDPIKPHESTFKYRSKDSNIFSKRKVSTVETRSEKRNRKAEEGRKRVRQKMKERRKNPVQTTTRELPRTMKHGGKVKKGGMAVIIIANKKSKK